MIDIGANLTNGAFTDDFDAMLERARQAGVDPIIVTGTDIVSSAAAIALTERHPQRLYCTVGVHPHDAAGTTGDWIADLERLAAAPSVRAIGECGLDFNRNYSPRDDQHRVFEAQLGLATRLRLPVFVHDRDTGGAVAEHLARHRSGLRDVVVHCFTGDAPTLRTYVALGCHIGITGWVCDERRGAELAAIVSEIPDDRLLIETDAPYLLPRTMNPRPRSRRNEPANLIWVARCVADARDQSLEHVQAITTINARRVFSLE